MKEKQKIPVGYKESALGIIPKDWAIIELGKLVDEKRPVSYGIVQTGEPVANGVKCIRVTDIIDGK